jgi:hypothetical protein
MTNDTTKAQNVASVVAKMKSHPGELLQRGLRKDPIEQRRQSHVDDEKIHPGQRRVGDLLELAAGKAMKTSPK